MSLKTFHIVFIASASILAMMFAVWEFLRFQMSGELPQLAASLVATATGVGLVVYGIRFLRKLRKVSFL